MIFCEKTIWIVFVLQVRPYRTITEFDCRQNVTFKRLGSVGCEAADIDGADLAGEACRDVP